MTEAAMCASDCSLFRNYGSGGEGDRVFYPIAALRAAGLWDRASACPRCMPGS